MPMTADGALWAYAHEDEYPDMGGRGEAAIREAFAIVRELEAELARWRKSDEHMSIMVEDLTGAMDDVLWRARKGMDSSAWEGSA